MALFGRWSRTGRLPADMLAQLDAFGRCSYDLQGSPPPDTFEADMYFLAQSDRDGFLADLAALVVPGGGWAAYDGMKLVRTVLSGGGIRQSPSWPYR